MSSIEPNDGGDEVNCAEEIASGLVIERSDAAVLLEPGKEVLDQMTSLVQMPGFEPLQIEIGHLQSFASRFASCHSDSKSGID